MCTYKHQIQKKHCTALWVCAQSTPLFKSENVVKPYVLTLSFMKVSMRMNARLPLRSPLQLTDSAVFMPVCFLPNYLQETNTSYVFSFTNLKECVCDRCWASFSLLKYASCPSPIQLFWTHRRDVAAYSHILHRGDLHIPRPSSVRYITYL